MLARCLGKSQYRSAGGAFAVDVCLSIAIFVFAELEKSAKAIVFAAAGRDVSGEHSKEHPDHHRARAHVIKYGKPDGINEEGNYSTDYYPTDVDPKHYFGKRICAVSSVHEAV